MHGPEHDELCVLSHAGELDPKKQQELEVHRGSGGCVECAELLKALESGSAAASAAAISLPEGRLEKIADAVFQPEEERGLPAALPVLRLLWGTAALTAVLAIGLFMKVERAPDPELAWSNGLETEMSRLSSEFEFFGESSASVFEEADDFSTLDENLDELQGRISL